MPSYMDSYFGQQDLVDLSNDSNATITITDGDLSVSFTKAYGEDAFGWTILSRGWTMGSTLLKGGGFVRDSKTADGSQLVDGYWGNVTETFQCMLHFSGTDQMQQEIEVLEELLKVRALAYWKEPANDRPVWIERAVPGESNSTFCLINNGSVIQPDLAWCVQATYNSLLLSPVQVSFTRQPIWSAAQPLTEQGNVRIQGRQYWDYNLTWSVEDASPTDDVRCFVELANGDIYAGCDGEMWYWNGTVWASQSVAPASILGNITEGVLLPNGDILWADSGGQVLKRSSAGVWSQESSLPTGGNSIMRASTGNIYYGGTGTIYRRDNDGVWSSDGTEPTGEVRSIMEVADTGRLIAAAQDQTFMRTLNDPSDPVDAQVASALNNAEQYGNGTMMFNETPYEHLHVGNKGWVGMRFVLDVPAGATISKAWLHVWHAQECKDAVMANANKIYCEAADDAAIFQDVANNLSGRSLTTAYVAYQDLQPGRRKWEQEDTPDITAPLQEVIDRTGWATGQHVVVIVKGDTIQNKLSGRPTRRHWAAYEKSPGRAPILNVEYSTAEGAGAAWEVLTSHVGTSGYDLLEKDDLILAARDSALWGSTDNGLTWQSVQTGFGDPIHTLYEDRQGVLWLGDADADIWNSVDGGRNWTEKDSSTGTTAVYSFIDSIETDDLRAGDASNILILDASDRVLMGRSETTTDEVFVANHNKVSNLTHVWVDDGGSFGSNLLANDYTVADITLLPAVPAQNDALYIGTNTALANTGPFTSAVFDINQIAISTTSYAITIEYYNGSWVTLTTHDETSSFSQNGVNGVFWSPPSDWTTVAVNGVTGYWVRFRLSALTGTLTPPTQQNRDPYVASWSHISIDDDEIEGTFDALARLTFHNRSDVDGPGGSAPNLYTNRLIAGVKPTANHTQFQAFINMADEQQPDGISLDLSVDPDSATSYGNSTMAPTGRRVFFDAGIANGGNGLNNFEDRISIDVSTTTCRDWYGTYKLLIRQAQSGGSAGEVEYRIKVVTGSGGISSLSEVQRTDLQGIDYSVIEFNDPISIPVSSLMGSDEVPDQTSIIIQISATAADADAYIYDIALIPTDIAWIDAKDTANTAESAIEDGRALVIDKAIRIPKGPTRSLVQNLSDGSKVSSWNVTGNGPAFPTKQALKVHFVTLRTTAAAASTWISDPAAVHSPTFGKVERWSFGRGND
jgi:hypothetical protein